MTTDDSRLSRHDAFDAARRAEATKYGEPTPRTQVPAVPMAWHQKGAHAPLQYVYVTVRAKKIYAADISDRSAKPAPMSVETLANLVLPQEQSAVGGGGDRWSNGGVLVLPDHIAAGALQRLVSDPRNRDHHAALSRLLTVCRSLDASSRVVVLTEALTRGFWPPKDVDISDLSQWSRAFGIQGRGMGAVRELLRKAMGKDLPQPGVDQLPWGPVGTAISAETQVARYVHQRGVAAEIRRFDHASLIHNALSFALVTDPLMRDRSALDGTVLTLTPLAGQGSKLGLAVRIEGSFKIRDGKEVLLLPPGPVTSTRMEQRARFTEVRPDGRGFVAVLRDAGSQVAKWHASSATGQFVETPFLANAPRATYSKWTRRNGQDGAPERVIREVPLTISLAGAPQEGQGRAAA